MKSTERLIDNLMNDDFKRAKVDIQKATDHILKSRVEQEKQAFIKQLTEK